MRIPTISRSKHHHVQGISRRRSSVLLEQLDSYLLLSASGVNIVVIDDQLVDWAMLRRAAAKDAIVISYDPRVGSAQDILQSVVRTARGSPIDSLTILGHGQPGEFQLGCDWVSQDTLPQELTSWRNLAAHLDSGARIYLFGCAVVDPSGAGQRLIDRLGQATHASVYASTDLTGRGGDWVLEAASAGAAALNPSIMPLTTAELAGYPGQLAVGVFPTNQDIGTVSVPGSASYSSGTYTVTGSGTDIWGTGDSFQFCYGSVSGAGSIVARVTAVQNTNVYAKGGVMFRDSTAANAAYAILAYQPAGRVTFEYRASNGATANFVGQVSAALPIWVKLVRGGTGNNTFSAYYSTNGTAWTLIGTQTVTMSANALVGLAVTSRNSGVLNTSTFDNVSLSGSSSPTVATPANASPNPITGTTTSLSVLGASTGGEAGLTCTWSATAQPAGSNPVFSVNGTNAAKNTTVAFDKAGSYSFLVTISDGTLMTTSSVTVTVNQTLTTITLSPSTVMLNLNQSRQFSATGYDQFGLLLASQPSFTWSVASGVGSISAGGLYSSAATAGSATVQAASGAINGTAAITVSNAAPTVTIPASANPSPVTGTTTALSVLGADDGGAGNLTYTWSAIAEPSGANPAYSANGSNAARNSTVTFDRSGSYTFRVTISDGSLTTTSSSTVTVSQTLSSIIVAPASVSLNLNQTQQFSALGYDQFGQALATQPSFNWSELGGVGSISSSGSYNSGGSAGSATIQAASGTASANASISVVNAAPAIITPANASLATVSGTTTTLSILASDDGGESNLTYTWSLTSMPSGSNPIFSSNASNAARNTTVTFDDSGAHTFLVTISDGVNSITSSVDVTVVQTLTRIAVTPGSANLNLNGSQQFAVTGFDQFDHPLAAQPAFAWTLAGGVGGVDSSGLVTSSA